MSIRMRRSLFLAVSLVSVLGITSTSLVMPQSRRQPPSSDQKKNKRPDQTQQTDEQKPEPLPPDIMGKQQEAEKVTTTTNLVNVDAVVYNKKTGQPQINLKKDNFGIFVDGVKKEITNFSTPEAPITATLVVEYSKLAETLGYYGSNGMSRARKKLIG